MVIVCHIRQTQIMWVHNVAVTSLTKKKREENQTKNKPGFIILREKCKYNNTP